MELKRKIGLLLGPVLFLLIHFFFRPVGLSEQGNAVLASVVWIAVWWITEAIPIEVTSLLPLVLLPLTGGLDLKEAGAAYGHKFIFLFIGGFVLAIAIEKWQLHRRIALRIIQLVGASYSRIMLGFMLSTAFLSMWISNTATTVMMLPIGLAVVSQIATSDPAQRTQFGKALMLSIAYSASIGGMATLIGTPPNLIFVGVVQKMYGVEISFLQWLKFGLPISVLLLGCCWYYLSHSFRLTRVEMDGSADLIRKQLVELGRISREEVWVLLVFITTALAWITRSFFLKKFIPAIDDTIIALLAAFLLFIIPGRKKSEGLLTWPDAVKLPWGVLLLFGGGIAIAAGFQASGLAIWLGEQLTNLSTVPILVALLMLVAGVNFLTEITSNIATTAILLPILASLAVVLNVHPFLLLGAATVAASCAFMLPVATPPNAIVFGSGFLTIPDMVRSGFWLNLLSILVLTALVYYWLPWVWDFDLVGFPFGDVVPAPN